MRSIISFALVLAIYMTSVVPLQLTVIAQGRVSSPDRQNIPDGLTFRLSDADPSRPDPSRPSPPTATVIPDSDAGKILSRLPAIRTVPDDASDFAKRLGSQPPPKTGTRVPVKFPADAESQPPPRADQTKRELSVVRYAPEGNVGLAPDLTITFSQPMVAITSQDQAAESVPVVITPNVKGQWRWLGTQTLMFDAETRFPMATKFMARVPAGTRSVNGEAIASDFAWEFTTPAPSPVRIYPNGQITRRDQAIFIEFDQAIDPIAAMAKVTLTANGKRLKTRLIYHDEAVRDPSIGSYVANSERTRVLSFRAVNEDGSSIDALPADATIKYTIDKGFPSAEGPLTTEQEKSYQFKTYGPMKYVRSFCNWERAQNCTPFDPFYVEFTNQIDQSTITAERVIVTPAIDRMNVVPYGNRLQIQGVKKENTEYTIRVKAGLSDAFGQKTNQDSVSTIRTGRSPSNLFSQGGHMSVLDPSGPRSFSIYTINHRSVNVKLYAVSPMDYGNFLKSLRTQDIDTGEKNDIPGRLVSNEAIQIASKDGEMVETSIDLSRALTNGLGHVVLLVEPTTRRDRNDRSRVLKWLQSTQIGIDAFVDHTDIVAFATELKTGKPVGGAKVRLGSGRDLAQVETDEQIETAGIVDRIKNWVASIVPFAFWSDGSTAESETGTPISVETVPQSYNSTTAANGVARVRIPPSRASNEQDALIVTRGNDSAILPENSEYYWQTQSNWYPKVHDDQFRWFVFDDRKMYKPGEDVSVKGMIRRYVYGPSGDIEPIGSGSGPISYTVKDQRGNDITTGEVSVNSFGAFDLKFKLKDNVDLGYATISFLSNSLNSSFSHNFQIQEFRRPEFEVTAKVETPAPHFVKGNVTVGVEAKYYAGGALPDAATRWTVSATATNYTPPGRDEFVFGIWTPWWENPYARGVSGRWAPGYGNTQYFNGKTDSDGKHRIKVDLDSANPPRPYAMIANAAVEAVNRQTWASNASFLVHPSELYVGIRSKRYFVQRGSPIEIDTIVTDIEGKAVAGRAVKVKAVLRDNVFEKGNWIEKIVDEATCEIMSSDKPEQCKFIAKNGGRYTIEAEVSDNQVRPNVSRMTIWVPGGKTMPTRTVEEERVEIIPSQKDYKPGDVAELLVISPIAKAEGIMTIRREGIVKTERFTMLDNAITLKVPIDEAYLPNIHVSIDLVGNAPRVGDDGQPPSNANLPPRPAFASGTLDLAVSSESRRLNVTAVAEEKELTPGSATKVNVLVTDGQGKPAANTEVAIVVVDEAILALSNYSITDPVAAFYTNRADGVQVYKSRSKLLLNDPGKIRAEELSASGSAGGLEMSVASRQISALPAPPPSPAAKMIADDSVSAEISVSGEPDKPIEMRADFSALANFTPSVRTDSRGRAVIDIKLPDNLTRYRVTAVANDGAKRFGKSESDITARLPLMIRPSAPRFLNFGDRAELPVVVQNQTSEPLIVDVAVRSTNTELVGGTSERNKDGVMTYRHGKRVTVPANDRVEVMFSSATVKAGTARFQFAATAGKFSDAAEISLPVWTPATTEAFATYGSIEKDDTIFQPISLPGNIFTQFGGIEVSTSTTQLQELTDAYIYLANYQYACSEQISSRMIATAALRDVLSAFKSKDMPTKEQLDRQFAADVQVLASRQRDDGSFGLWRRERGEYEYPYLTIHVAHALGLAKQKGYNVPDAMIAKTRPYLANIERYFDDWHKRSPESQWTVSAYALYVRELLGDRDTAKAKKLLNDATIEKLPFESIGWILSVIASDAASVEEANKIVRFLLNRTTETAATANFVTNYRDAAWLTMASDRRADGVILNALVKMAGGSATNGERAELTAARDLIPKVVRGLMAHRKKGAWANTQENVFILLAMDRYFAAFEGVTPDLVAKVWIGNAFAGEQLFKGRSTDVNELLIPMSYVAEQGGSPTLALDRRGAGRLYYRIGLKYAPSNLRLEAADRGFAVTRRYEAVDEATDVKENPDGSWTIKSGARVRVKLSMIAPSRRYHVALVDYLPAGFEILNTALANTEAIPNDRLRPIVPLVRGRSTWIGRSWYEHQNLRDERAEAFASLVWGGNYEYSFVVRATTPGSFIAPPAKAEEMYHPETFGRSKTDLVRIE